MLALLNFTSLVFAFTRRKARAAIPPYGKNGVLNRLNPTVNQ